MEAGLTRDGDGDGVGNLVGTEDEAGGNDITGRGTADYCTPLAGAHAQAKPVRVGSGG
jgi:hypothetical protein